MENNKIEVLFEDEHLVVINKPAGLVVHSDGRTVEASVLDWLRQNYLELKDVGGLHTLDSGRYVERFGIVHRLDRETSGVLMIAKDTDTFFALQRQFISRTNTKIYNAFVEGIPLQKSGDIDLPIGRGRADFRQWETGDKARGTLRQAITQYEVIGSSNEYSYVKLSPKTGRTHQLRVHMKAIGHPILADKRYGGKFALGFSRVALHAYSLSIDVPHLGERTFVAHLPDDFIFALKQIGVTHLAEPNH